MNLHQFSKYLAWCCLFALSLLAGCNGRDAVQLRNSVYRTRSSALSLNRDLQRIQDSINGLLGNNEQGAQDSLGYSPIAQKHVLNRYRYLYDVLNPEEKNHFGPDNISWDSLQGIYYIKRDDARKLQSRYEVFGWHPYWMGSAWQSYSFKLLSTIAYYAYKVDPETGAYTNPGQMQEWLSTPMLDTARAYGCKTLLTIANHGYEENRIFLNNESAWSTLLDTVASLVKARQADGVDINFEMVPEELSRQYARFITQARTGLNARISGKKVFISATLPAYSNREAFDLSTLQANCDLLVIMGYAFHAGKESGGPVAPMRNVRGGKSSLVETVDYYLKAGIEPQKTVLALPYYGAQWRGQSTDGRNYETWFEKEITYREVMQLYGRDYIAQYDPISMSNYHFLQFPDSTSAECWFDDAFTLNKKYDLALGKGFKGVGIWALGYDNGYTELWDLLDRKFTTDTLTVVDPIAEAEGYPIRLGNWALKHQTMLLAAFLFFALAFVVGLLIAFSDWRVRESALGNQLGRFTVMLVATILIIPLLAQLGWFRETHWGLLIGYLCGAITALLILKLRFTYHSNRP